MSLVCQPKKKEKPWGVSGVWGVWGIGGTCKKLLLDSAGVAVSCTGALDRGGPVLGTGEDGGRHARRGRRKTRSRRGSESPRSTGDTPPGAGAEPAGREPAVAPEVRQADAAVLPPAGSLVRVALSREDGCDGADGYAGGRELARQSLENLGAAGAGRDPPDAASGDTGQRAGDGAEPQYPAGRAGGLTPDYLAHGTRDGGNAGCYWCNLGGAGTVGTGDLECSWMDA